MTRSQIQPLAVITLLLVFAGVWVTTRKQQPLPEPRPLPSVVPLAGRAVVPETPSHPSPPKEPAPLAETALVRDVFQMPSLLFQRLQERERERRQAKQAAAPPEPVAPAPVAIPELHLQGIFWGTPKPQALINRRILSVGDPIEGATVLSIDKNRVILSFFGQQVTLEPPLPVRPRDSDGSSG